MDLVEEDLNDFIAKVELLCAETNTAQNVPPIEIEDFGRYPILTKSPKIYDKNKNEECKRCLLLKKQFDDQLLMLETKFQTKMHELFDMYSFINAKIIELERKHKI